MKEYIIIGLILCIVLVSGCAETSVEDTGSGKMIPEEQLKIYGTLTDFEKEGNLTKLYIAYEVYNCEKNSSSTVISAIMQKDELIKGNDYMFDFIRIDENHDWKTWINPRGIEDCADFHNSDLIIDKKQEVKQVGDIAALLQTNLIPNEPTQISSDVINRQDIDIDFKVFDVAVVDEIGEAVIDECEIDYDKDEQTSGAGSTNPLTFTITCNEPIDCKKSYESCDIHGENCKMVTLPECQFHISGKISFIDELGFEHIKPVLIKQEVRIK